MNKYIHQPWTHPIFEWGSMFSWALYWLSVFIWGMGYAEVELVRKAVRLALNSKASFYIDGWDVGYDEEEIENPFVHPNDRTGRSAITIRVCFGIGVTFEIQKRQRNPEVVLLMYIQGHYERARTILRVIEKIVNKGRLEQIGPHASPAAVCMLEVKLEQLLINQNQCLIVLKTG